MRWYRLPVNVDSLKNFAHRFKWRLTDPDRPMTLFVEMRLDGHQLEVTLFDAALKDEETGDFLVLGQRAMPLQMGRNALLVNPPTKLRGMVLTLAALDERETMSYTLDELGDVVVPVIGVPEAGGSL